MAVLIDITKCIGCESCSVACKLYNSLDFKSEPRNIKNGRIELDDNRWTVIHKYETEDKRIRFVKKQCLHCKEPACVSACFSKAIQKDEETGAVVYYPDLCVGCRYCMVACPYEIPKYQWDEQFPKITKCEMCPSRLENGDAPACVAVCPTNALISGDRDELLKKAHEIIASDSKYVQHVYGENEVGGSEWMYISDIPFEELGFKMVSETPVTKYTKDYISKVPILAVIWGIFLASLSYYNHRNGHGTHSESEEDFENPDDENTKDKHD